MIMKRMLFILVALLALTGQANAQRYLPGMRGIEMKGGFVDGFQSPVNYYMGAAISAYTKHGNRWVFGAEFLKKDYPYKDIQIPKIQITAEGGYLLNILSDPSKIFFFSIGGAVLAGYETSRNGNKLLPDGATLLNKDVFIYGGAVTLELETYLTDRIILLLNARERVLWGSSIGLFHTQFGVGLKFMIN